MKNEPDLFNENFENFPFPPWKFYPNCKFLKKLMEMILTNARKGLWFMPRKLMMDIMMPEEFWTLPNWYKTKIPGCLILVMTKGWNDQKMPFCDWAKMALLRNSKPKISTTNAGSIGQVKRVNLMDDLDSNSPKRGNHWEVREPPSKNLHDFITTNDANDANANDPK